MCEKSMPLVVIKRVAYALEEGYRFAPKASRRPSNVKSSGEWREKNSGE